MADDGDEKFIDWMTDLRSEPRAFRIKTKSRVTVTHLRLYSLYVRVCAAAAKSCCRLSAALDNFEVQLSCPLYPPKEDTCICTSASLLWANGGHLVLFDHLVGTGKQCRRNGEAEGFGGFEIDHKFVLGGCLHRHVGRLLALEDAIDVTCRAPDWIKSVGAICNQAAVNRIITKGISSWQFVLGCQLNDEIAASRRTARRND